MSVTAWAGVAAAIAHAVTVHTGRRQPVALVTAAGAAAAGVLALAAARAAPHSALAVAAAIVALGELARPAAMPAYALVAAVVAGVLAPAFAVLPVLVAIDRYLRERDRRWLVVGLLAIALGGVALFAIHPLAMPRPALVAHAAGAALGPLLAVAALGGLALACTPRLPWLVSAAAAVALDPAGASTIGLAAVAAGLAVHRFASAIRLASGQGFVAATCVMMLAVPLVLELAG